MKEHQLISVLVRMNQFFFVDGPWIVSSFGCNSLQCNSSRRTQVCGAAVTQSGIIESDKVLNLFVVKCPSSSGCTSETVQAYVILPLHSPPAVFALHYPFRLKLSSRQQVNSSASLRILDAFLLCVQPTLPSAVSHQQNSVSGCCRTVLFSRRRGKLIGLKRGLKRQSCWREDHLNNPSHNYPPKDTEMIFCSMVRTLRMLCRRT